MRIDVEEFIKRLEKLGEKRVWERLMSGHYDKEKSVIVREWLLSKEKEKNEKERHEYIRIVKSAQLAAWLAAIASIIGVIITIINLLLKGR